MRVVSGVVAALLLVSPDIGWSGSNGLPPMQEWRVGWIKLRPGSTHTDGGSGVLRNRGKAPVFVSMGGGTPAITLLAKTNDGWGFAGPAYCGNALSLRELAPGDSLAFAVFMPGMSEGRYRLAIPIRDAASGRWSYAISVGSMRLGRPSGH